MKQTLVIGSAVIDVIITLPHLPKRGEDINIDAPLYRLGGCAYNVYETLRFFESPAFLCSPVGKGVYGSMVCDFMEKRNIKPLVHLDEENGCCYCLIESNGERSFLSHHGAEYLFSRSWLLDYDFSKACSVYVSGIDVEDRAGDEIIDFVYEHPELTLYFSPGPRIMYIDPVRITRILSRRDNKGLGPVLHLNYREVSFLSGKDNTEEAALFISEITGNAVIITLGEKGSYCYDKNIEAKGSFIPGFPAKAVDTTGAGDAHCGAAIACLKQGKTLAEACEIANKTGAAAAGIHGIVLEKGSIYEESILS